MEAKMYTLFSHFGRRGCFSQAHRSDGSGEMKRTMAQSEVNDGKSHEAERHTIQPRSKYKFSSWNVIREKAAPNETIRKSATNTEWEVWKLKRFCEKKQSSAVDLYELKSVNKV